VTSRITLDHHQTDVLAAKTTAPTIKTQAGVHSAALHQQPQSAQPNHALARRADLRDSRHQHQSRHGVRGWGGASHRPPQGLPRGKPGRLGWRLTGDVAPGAPRGRATPGRWDAPPAPACEIRQQHGITTCHTPPYRPGRWCANRSFSAGGAPPGHLPLACYKTSPPTRRDTRSRPFRPAVGQHPACAISVPLTPVNHGQQRGTVTRPDHR
jgi:hypothetical protein